MGLGKKAHNLIFFVRMIMMFHIKVSILLLSLFNSHIFMMMQENYIV
jgi:hypothetical protein